MATSLEDLGRLYRERYPRFYRLARALTGDDELAFDAVQDAFARAVRSRLSFRGDSSAETWVWRTLINVCRDQRRRPGLVVDTLALPEESTSQNGHAEEFPELRGAIAALPQRQRLILFLYHYADLDQETIATVTAVRRGTVAATLHQAHTSLRRALTEVAT
jgi:RNA polymerase sigma-70 factor (ECF subfamily)